jgi:hypothetical protein
MPAHITPAEGAAALLRRNGYPAADIVWVDRDSILFTTGDAIHSAAHTAWLHGSLVFLVERGFVAEEPAGLHPAGLSENFGRAGGTV